METKSEQLLGVVGRIKNLSPEKLHLILSRLPSDEKAVILGLLNELETRKKRQMASDNFMDFVEQMWPTFIGGRHHKRIAGLFEKVANGEIKRLIINLGPRHTKSKFASFLLPAWFLGKFPHKQVIQASHTAELAVGFGRDVRNLVDSDVYKNVFPNVSLQSDSKAAGRWDTNFGGKYFAIGISGAVTGRGADLLIIDDPHSEAEATIGAFNPEVYDKVYEWYTSGPRQRLQPGGAIIIVMTRWSSRDLTAQVLKSAAMRDSDEWTVVEFPALLPSGEPLWPEFWSKEELTALKNELPNPKWMAQYQQQPTSDSSAIIKREWWKWWEETRPPKCEFIIQSWDTAHETKNVNDYSACTTWGVWYNDADKGLPNIILLNAFRDRLEFPELKKVAFNEWKEWEPDSFLVEKKAAGAPLIQEFRAMGISVQEFSPGKGQDKISRLNAVSDIFASGKVWVPRTRWAEEVVDEVASFPAGEHDDLCLSAGTKVLMADGSEKAIELVVVGDMVMTHEGPNRVTACGPTQISRTYTLESSLGKLIGTGNHPIYTAAGWKRLDELNRGDTIVKVSINRGSSWLQNVQGLIGRLSCSMGTHIKNILSAGITKKLGGGNSYIGMFGSFIMGPYLQDIMSTTSMGTQQTMRQRIYKPSPVQHISPSIKKIELHGGDTQINLNTLRKYAPCQLRGTGLKLDGRGTENTLNRCCIDPGIGESLKVGNQSQRYVPCVRGSLVQRIICAGLCALRNATMRSIGGSDGRLSYRWNTVVANALKYLTRSTQYNSIVATGVKVYSIEENENSEVVYNLTVDKAHTYVANGVLTHNCDSMTLALSRFRQGGYMQLPSDEPEPIQYFKSNRRSAYY